MEKCAKCNLKKKRVKIGSTRENLESDSNSVPIYFSFCEKCDRKNDKKDG